MKKYLYLLIIPFSLSNCYNYKVASETDESKNNPKEIESKAKVKPNQQAAKMAVAANQATLDVSTSRLKTAKAEKPVKPRPTSITEKLEAGKYFKIDVADRSYKIQVDKWESDTLVAHVIHKPKKILKFHKNQINQSTIAERHFSQPVADILTVAAYTGIGVGIWALVR